MLKRAQATIAIALAIGAVAALPTTASAQYGSGYYSRAVSGPYGGNPGPYGGYTGAPYGGLITSNVAYSYNGYGSQYGGPYSGPFRTDSAPLTGGGY